MSSIRDPSARWNGILEEEQKEPFVRFLMNSADQHDSKGFRIEFIIAIAAALNWFRLITML